MVKKNYGIFSGVIYGIYYSFEETKKEKKIKINSAVKEALEYYFKKASVTDPDNYLFTSYRSNQKLDRIRVW